MNSRQRVILALNHKEPDKVPMDCGATIVTAPTRIAYQNLRAYLGMGEDPTPRTSHRQMETVYPAEDLYRRYEVDFRTVAMKGPWEFEPREMPDDSFYDEFDIRWKKASYYYDVVERPLANCSSVADLDKAVSPDPYDPGRVSGLREEARALHDASEYAIVADIMALGPFEGACILRGYEAFVRRTFDIMAPGGGFVFFPSHNIQADVTPERFHAAFDAALRYRTYSTGD